MSSIAELIRRAQLARQLQSVGGGGIPQDNQASQIPTQAPVQAPVQPQQVQAPPQQDPRQTALGDYRQALSQPAPRMSDYHPSKARSILAPILGGIAGLHDPKTGYQVGHDVKFGPFDRQMSEYQQRLAQKKAAFETEESAAKEAATEGELKARGREQDARAEEAKARAAKERFSITPEGIKAAREVRHPLKLDIYKVPLKNGEEITAYWDNEARQMIDTNNDMPIGPDAYDTSKIYKIGTEPKVSAPKVGTMDAALEKYAKEHGKVDKEGKGDPSLLTYAETVKVRNDWQQTPAQGFERVMVGQHAEDAPIDASYKMHSAYLEKDFTQLDNAVQKYSELDTMLNQNNAQSDAIVAPKLLSAAVGGMGSGLRMTNSEIERVVGGRTKLESLRSELNKFSADPQHYVIPSEQRAAIRKLSGELKTRINAKLKANQEARDELIAVGADKTAHRKVLSNYRKKITAIDTNEGTSETKSEEKVIDYVVDPKTGRLVPKQ